MLDTACLFRASHVRELITTFRALELRLRELSLFERNFTDGSSLNGRFADGIRIIV